MTVPAADAVPRETRVRRLQFLAERLGIPADIDSPLYYQLLHRTVSAILEATLTGASTAVLLVHSFAKEDDLNWKAYSDFLQALGAPAPAKDVVSGPIAVPSTPALRLFALWHADTPVGPPT